MKIIGGIIGISLTILFLLLVVRLILPGKNEDDDGKMPKK